MQLKADLRTFILTEIVRDPTYPLEDDEPLITGGLIDSFSLTQVGLFIEERAGVRIPDAHLTVANMDTLEQMLAMVAQHRK